jgi:hypothetical protein
VPRNRGVETLAAYAASPLTDRVRRRHDVARCIDVGTGTRIAKVFCMPARAIDTATIAFGLVSIPIKIF